jgi:hypothetical protein
MNFEEKSMTQRGVVIIKRADEKIETKNAASETNPHPISERASLEAFRTAGERWLSALPDGKRAKLASDLSAAGTDAAKVELLVESATSDITKVRAAHKRALLDAAGAELAR